MPVDRSGFSCSFCGLSHKEVDTLIAGPLVYICNQCVETCVEVLNAKREKRPFVPIDPIPVNQEKKMSHNKFKMFVGPYEADDDFGKLAARVTAFGVEVASKSIGVEYLESSKKLVITLGYSDQETPFPITLTEAAIGRKDQIDDNDDFSVLEAAMSQAADEITDVICHELFITDTGSFLMVILAKAKA